MFTITGFFLRMVNWTILREVPTNNHAFPHFSFTLLCSTHSNISLAGFDYLCALQIMKQHSGYVGFLNWSKGLFQLFISSDLHQVGQDYLWFIKSYFEICDWFLFVCTKFQKLWDINPSWIKSRNFSLLSFLTILIPIPNGSRPHKNQRNKIILLIFDIINKNILCKIQLWTTLRNCFTYLL